MPDVLNQHEPSREFAARLESQIRSEVRRRNRSALAPRWAGWSPVQTAAALIALVCLSMAVGGAAVAASYESEQTQVRDQLLASLQQRADLASQRLETAVKEHQKAEAGFAVGLETAAGLRAKGVAMADAKAQLDLVHLELAEIRQTGREPRREVSAPRAGGRDFAGERLRIEMSVPERALELERRLAQVLRVRLEIGLISRIDLDASAARMTELEASLETFRRKLDIRQRFLNGLADAVETELRVLEAEAEQQVKVLAPKIALANQEVARVKQRVEIGLAQPVDLAEANVRRLELEIGLSKAELDLALIRRRVAQDTGR